MSELDRTDYRIVRLLAEGWTDAQVAQRLGVSERTVQRHIRRVMLLLGARSRFQAGVLAAGRGWL